MLSFQMNVRAEQLILSREIELHFLLYMERMSPAHAVDSTLSKLMNSSSFLVMFHGRIVLVLISIIRFSRKCAEGCLNSSLVKNKIVVCNELADSTEAFQAGAAGIIKKTPSIFPPFVVPFRESRLTRDNFGVLLNYINSTKSEKSTKSFSHLHMFEIVDFLDY